MFLQPMLLETAARPFSHSDYIFEPKVDGHRLIFSQQSGIVRLYTRHNNDCTKQYPELHLPFNDDVILDGEVACVDPATGLNDFEAVMSRFSTKQSRKIQQLTSTLPVTFAIFDILQYRGRDLRKLPLMERKEILHGLSLPSRNFGIIPYIVGAGEDLFAQIELSGMEGMVCKRKDSLYVSRRSRDWKKVINWTHADVYITGFKKAEFGWLAAVPDLSGKMRSAGIIELGVGPEHKQAFRGVCQQLVIGEDKDYVYLKPRIRVKVKMRNWTKSGLLRIPVFDQFIV
ncbi:ATP-dependent DNA ligase [Paenibacillus enshidis]|uniref:ATP-dependent DNA ligase n=1 Tax=Paenibacillus enshidis TaxID=1458439 RepID=A0ABV5AVF7_9BACL